MSELVIDIVGFPGSGKSSVCNHLVRAYGFSLYRPSDSLRAYAKQHNRTLDGREDYVRVHEELIASDPNAIVQPIYDSNDRLVCLDGMRAPAPFRRLKRELDAKLIYLECPIEQRFARILSDTSRTGHRAQPSIEAFQKDESADYHNDNPHLPSMDEMIALADYTIDASQPFDTMLKRIDTIIEELL